MITMAWRFSKTVVRRGNRFGGNGFCIFDYKKLFKLRYIILALAGIFLVAVLIPGVGVNLNGSSRWIRVLGISIQPAEIAKDCADYFYRIFSLSQPQAYGYPALWNAPPSLCFANLRTFVFPAELFGDHCAGGAHIYHDVCGVGCKGLAPCRIGRHRGCRRSRTHGAGALSGCASRILYGSVAESDGGRLPGNTVLIRHRVGRAFGQGIGNGPKSLSWLPYGESDFIFSIIAEELGLIGAVLLLALFIFLIYRESR